MSLKHSKNSLLCFSDDLQMDYSIQNRNKFYGMLAVYLSSIYGHRTGVYTNLLVKEVEEAMEDDGQGFLIQVSRGY